LARGWEPTKNVSTPAGEKGGSVVARRGRGRVVRQGERHWDDEGRDNGRGQGKRSEGVGWRMKEVRERKKGRVEGEG